MLIIDRIEEGWVVIEYEDKTFRIFHCLYFLMEQKKVMSLMC